MPIEFACRCGKKLRAAEEHAGKRAKCNQCGQVTVIPAAKAVAAKAVAVKTAAPATRSIGSKPSTTKTVATAAATNAASSIGVKAAAASGLDDLLSGEIPLPQPVPLKPVPVQGGRLCPNCKNPLSTVAVFCIDCGYNLKTGQKTVVAPLDEAEAPKKKKPPTSRLNQFFLSRITSWKLWSGLGLMAIAAIWFLLKTQTIQEDDVSVRSGRSFIYILGLFIVGGISFINGLFDGDNA
jgi:hypothetical protein